MAERHRAGTGLVERKRLDGTAQGMAGSHGCELAQRRSVATALSNWPFKNRPAQTHMDTRAVPDHRGVLSNGYIPLISVNRLKGMSVGCSRLSPTGLFAACFLHTQGSPSLPAVLNSS